MRETEPDVPIENNSADDLQLIVPNLHRRYSGVTATNRMVAPKLAKMFRAAWNSGNRSSGFPEIVAAPQFPDLARAAQQRDDRWRRVANARLAAKTGVHLGGAGAPHLGPPVA